MAEIDFLSRALRLNEVLRAGWIQRGVDEPQDVAGHSWGVVFLTMLYADEAERVDPDRAIRMAIIHDLPEAVAGDTVEGNGRTVERHAQFQQERDALQELVGGTKANGEIIELWTEFERRESPESRFVRDMDKIDMCLQALNYARDGRYDSDEIPEEHTALDEFFDSACEDIRTEVGNRLYRSVYDAYLKHR